MADKALEGEVVETGVLPPAIPEAGRPSIYSAAVVEKLIAAFNNGLNITEACMYAEIDRGTYYNWLAEHPYFSTRMAEAQAAPNKRAKEVIVQSINAGDASSAKWWLERKDPDFRNKGELLVNPEHERVENKLKGFMDDTDDEAYPDTSPGTDDVGAEPATEAQPEGRAEVAPSTPDIS
jgi:hypothetical protein